MEKNKKTYIAIDLKSFYASVECVERGLDALNTNLVVADKSRTEKTICLAVSPSLKSYGIPGRARLFEVIQKVTMLNNSRRQNIPGKKFKGKSYFLDELNKNPGLEIDYIVAPPQMAKYIEVSTKIFNIYMKYISPDDMHVYSIDEVFIDVTQYLEMYKMTPRQLTEMMIKDVLSQTGITATAGIGPNLYLCKIAMDVEAKHIKADENGVRIAELDEISFREKLWTHRPLTDFWRIGAGYSKRLESLGLFTMGDIARFSITGADKLYKTFGVNAELIIDHAWGYEPVEMEHIKGYRAENNSISTGQVLKFPYTFENALLVMKEMADSLVFDLVSKRLVTNQIVLNVGYDVKSFLSDYGGEIKKDWYGRVVPKHAHGSVNLGSFTSSEKVIRNAVTELFNKIVEKSLLIRRLNIVANHVIYEVDIPKTEEAEQLDFFTDLKKREEDKILENIRLAKERSRQEAIIKLREKYGRNAVIKAMSLMEGATATERNSQIGGHKA